MDKSIITDPFEAPKDGSLNTGMSTRRFLELGLKTLVAVGATKATNILGQTPLRTYDEIIVAITEGRLTYEELLEIGQSYGSTFSAEQKRVLSGKLSELKTAKEKTKPLEVETVVAENQKAPLNESNEEKKERLAREKEIEYLERSFSKLNKGDFFDKNAWASTNSKGANCEIRTSRNGVSSIYDSTGAQGTSPKATAFLKFSTKPGIPTVLNINNIAGTGAIQIKMTDEKGNLTTGKVLTMGANDITIPTGFGSELLLELITSPLSPEVTIEGMTINLQNNKFVGN